MIRPQTQRFVLDRPEESLESALQVSSARQKPRPKPAANVQARHRTPCAQFWPNPCSSCGTSGWSRSWRGLGCFRSCMLEQAGGQVPPPTPVGAGQSQAATTLKYCHVRPYTHSLQCFIICGLGSRCSFKRCMFPAQGLQSGRSLNCSI